MYFVLFLGVFCRFMVLYGGEGMFLGVKKTPDLNQGGQIGRLWKVGKEN